MWSPSKKTLSFDNDQLRLDTAEDAAIICDKLDETEVEILVLQGNTFGIEAAEVIGQKLADQRALREAHFKDMFTSRGREEVPIALSHILRGVMRSGAQLTLLDLSDNAIGPIGAPSVIEFLEEDCASKIEKLYMNNCGLGPEGSSSIATHLLKLKNLREFICGRNRLEVKGATNMSAALSNLTKLEKLIMNQNGIFPPGIIKICDILKTNRETLSHLDLSDNTIKIDASLPLAEFITQAQNLRSINLSDSLLGNDGFTTICDALSRCPNIDNFELASFEGNEIKGQKIIDTIQETFDNFPECFTLNLLENNFNQVQLARLNNMNCRYTLLADEVDSEEEDEASDNDQRSEDDDTQSLEEGQVNSQSDDSYVDIAASEIREISIDIVKASKQVPMSADNMNSLINQLISFGSRTNKFQAVQILCEELGLIKCEETRKKKALARDAVVQLGKRFHDLPQPFKDFLKITVECNDDLQCGKDLFKLDI